MTEEQAKALVDGFEQWLVGTSRGSKLSLAERGILMTFFYYTTQVGAKEAAPPAAPEKG